MSYSHYEYAIRLAGRPNPDPLAGNGDWWYADREDVPAVLARAQVHATLAVVDELRKLIVWTQEISNQLDVASDPLAHLATAMATTGTITDAEPTT